MEDLRQLAVNVERKIGLIKSRLLTADDQNLDKILLALRKFAPPSPSPSSTSSASAGGPQHSPDNMHDFYRSKKSKLEEALGELERIYCSLDLSGSQAGVLERRRDEYPAYRSKPDAAGPGGGGGGGGLGGGGGGGVSVTTTASTRPAPGPARTKSSSVYISPIPVATVQAESAVTPYPYHSRQALPLSKAEVDRQTQSEFDMISKSFQAIIDEVNKTASLVSSAAPQPSRPQPPLPEIKELQSKVYASREQDLQRHAASPESQRRTFNITVNSLETQKSPQLGPASTTPKSPPAVAPKPTFRVQTPAGLSPQLFSASSSSFSSQPPPTRVASSVVVSSPHPQAPVTTATSVVRAEVAKPAPEKRDPRVRGRFRPKTASQEREDATRRARCKSSPTISVQDLPGRAAEASGSGSGGQPTTAKSQVNFQIEPAPGAKAADRSRKPPLDLDVARAQQGATVELQLKPPAMFQDRHPSPAHGGDPAGVAASRGEPPARVVAPPFVVKAAPACAPPLDSKTVVYPGSPTVVYAAAAAAAPPPPTVAASSSSSAVAEVRGAPRHDAAASSSESSAEGRDKKSKRLGRGVAMMVELFSSSDEERLRRSHPLHTRSAPDLSADIASDDSTSVPAKDAANTRPAELSRVLPHRSVQTGGAHHPAGSPVSERKGVSGGGVSGGGGGGQGSSSSACAQSDALPSPQSPSSKPPFHPFKQRQQRSPDRGSESSPQRSAVPLSAEPPASVPASSLNATASTTTSTTTTTTTTTTSSGATAPPAAKVACPRVRPVRTSKTPDDDDDDDKEDDDHHDVPQRPRSFHELLSSFEPNVQRIGKLRTLRKCASDEGFPEDTVVRRVFRSSSFTSEPDLRAQRDGAPTPQGTVSFQLEVKVKA